MRNYFDDEDNRLNSKFTDFNDDSDDDFDYENDYELNDYFDGSNDYFENVESYLDNFETKKNVSNPAKSKYYRPVTQNAAYNRREEKSKQNKKKKKRKTYAKTVLSVLCVILIVFIGAGAYLVINTNNLMNKINYLDYDENNAYCDQSSLKSKDGITNILVMGLDDDGSGTYRSDSMILVSLDTINKKIKLTSFLRDMWLEIPGYKSTKMNAAFVYGGADLVIDTIEYNFNIDIDNYVFVDFQIFQNIVDELGGINVDITDEVSEAMAEFNCIVEPGTDVHLNGEETMWYARVRHCDSDFGRTSRQREVITLLIEKMKKKNIMELYRFGEDVLSEVKTGLSKKEIENLVFNTDTGNNILDYLSYDIEQCTVPADGYWWDEYIGDQAALVINKEKNIEILQEFIYG